MRAKKEDNKITKIALYKLRNDFDISTIQEKYTIIKSGNEKDWDYSIYTKITPPQLPSWFPLIKKMIDIEKIGKNIYSSLIIIFKKEDCLFALTAGYGYVDIHDFAIQDYGIDIALRAANPYELKILIQKLPIGNVFSFNRILRGKYIPESDVINKKSVLRQIAGKCQNINIGKSISGTTSLTISGKKSFEEIIDLLNLLIKVESQDPVVKISGLKQAPKEMYDNLDKALVNKISNKDFDDLFICYDDEKIQMVCEKIKIGKEEISFDDVNLILETAIKQNKNEPESVYLQGLDENDQKLSKKKLIDLLEGEVKYNDKIYFRINKKWYEANEDAINETQKEFLEIKSIDIPYLKDWIVKDGKPEEEGDFLNRIFKQNTDLVQAHTKKLISGNIEFSDIYDKNNKHIIHVKKGRGAFLRCLFAQCYVSGKLFAGDEKFKKEAKEKLGIDGTKPSENKIILAIFNPNQKNSPFTLFAKVDLVERVSALKENGYSVEYCLITPKYEK